MAEYVCLDGRMSVNGICPASSYPDYQKPAEDVVTPPITNNISGDQGEDKNFFTEKKDYSKKVKSNFQWDFDKVGDKIENFGDTITSNIAAYDDYIEENFGIPKKVSYGTRAVGVGIGIAKYGALGAVLPFTIPFIAGGALNNSEKRREEYEKAVKKNKDEIAITQNTVDTQYQNQMTNDGRDFSVSGENISSNKKGADNRASQERGYQLHG